MNVKDLGLGAVAGEVEGAIGEHTIDIGGEEADGGPGEGGGGG